MAVSDQPMLFENPGPMDGVVNVATVKQLSPFRYPGGKTWFVPHLKRWLASLPARPTLFIEPFAGGGSVSMAVLSEHLADHVVLNELDEKVVAVWQTIFSDDAEALADRIMAFDLTLENVHGVLASPANTVADRAFQTIVLNRVNRGGIISAGAGMIKVGEGGKGLSSRWYPDTLRNRILTLATHKNRVTVTQNDGLVVLETHLQNVEVAAFIDPPYTAGGKRAGSRLYTHSELDHPRLFGLAQRFAGNFVMTYDNAPEVLELSQNCGLVSAEVKMKNTHHHLMTELFIGRNLAWL